MEIYIHKEGQQIGPFTREQVVRQLHHGIVKATDLAWYDGLPDWKPLGEILAEDLWNDEASTEPAKASNATGWLGGLLIGALVAGAACYVVMSHEKQPALPAASLPKPVSSPTVAVVVNQPRPTPKPVAVKHKTPAPTVVQTQKQPVVENLPDYTITTPSPEPVALPSSTPTPERIKPSPAQAVAILSSPTATPPPVAINKPSATPEVSRDRTPAATGLTLDKNWKFGFKPEERAAAEFKNLLNGHGKANVDLEPHPNLTIYKTVTYLMPFSEAVKALNLEKQISSKTQVKCPGWPPSSFDFYGFAGLFDGHYNRLFLVVDRADHVVAVELIDESPKGQPVGYEDEKCRLFVYDFVQDQYRIDATCRVIQKAETDRDYKSLRIDSRFYGRNTVSTNGNYPYHRTLSGSWSYGNSVLVLQEDVRLYLPQPIVDLILYHIK